MEGFNEKTTEVNGGLASKAWFDPVNTFLGGAVFLCWITANTCGFLLYVWWLELVI